MKEIKVKFTLGIGFAGARHEEKVTIEFEDDTTKEEIENIIEEEWKEWTYNYIDGGWDIIEEGKE